MYLPDVMKQGCDPNSLDILSTQANTARNDLGIVRHPTGMTRCVRISCLYRLHHEFEQLSIHLLQLRIRLVQLANSQKWNAQRGSADCTRCHINPSKQVDHWNREHIIWHGRESVLLPNMEKTHPGTNCNSSAHQRGIGKNSPHQAGRV